MEIQSTSQACALGIISLDYLINSDEFDKKDADILRAARTLCGMQMMH